jgi:3-oxoacyl-[acyl-carrier protein] reductase
MDIDFKNKNVLITGASRGLGFDLTKKYLDYGANVISVSRSGIKKINSKHIHLKLDLEKKYFKEKLLLFFKKKKTFPDILINNLGGDLKDKNPLMNYSSFEKILRLNFGIGVELVNLLSPYMKKKNYGRICFISSISGLENQGSPAYCASKAAINAYVRFLNNFINIWTSFDHRINLIAFFFTKITTNHFILRHFYLNYSKISFCYIFIA